MPGNPILPIFSLSDFQFGSWFTDVDDQGELAGIPWEGGRTVPCLPMTVSYNCNLAEVVLNFRFKSFKTNGAAC